MSMMASGLQIPAHCSLSPKAFTAFSNESRIRRSCPQSASLSIRGCADESDDSAKETARSTSPSRPTKDTRLHWGSSDEGWLGTVESPLADPDPAKEVLSTWRSGRNDPMIGILFQAANSHYRYLELTPDAEAEEIKAAYRRLSKAYHPDTTALPLDLAAEKFVRLKEAYTVLSSDDKRRLYDWQLAQTLYPKKGSPSTTYNYDHGKTMADDGTRISQPMKDNDFIDDPIDTLGGRNMKLSDQAQAAVAFDAFAILVAVFAIVYAIFFKQT